MLGKVPRLPGRSNLFPTLLRFPFLALPSFCVRSRFRGRSLLAGLAWLGCVGGSLGAVAALRAEEVEVAAVRFTPNVRAPNGAPGNWYESDIVLDVKPLANEPGRMVSHVHVTLTLGFELPAVTGSNRHVEYYRAAAECVALDAGRADVRFYLPPELVKRDQLHGEPKGWVVELAIGDHAVAGSKNSVATALAGAEPRRAFQTWADGAVAATAGLLQPQYLTVFAGEYPRATPTFVRR